MMDDSDMLRLWVEECVAMGSRLSVRGEPRLDDGDGTPKGLDCATEGGVGRGMVPFGDLRRSTALSGVAPPEVMEAGVRSWGLLVFWARIRGAGEALRSIAGDLGGT